MQEINRMTGGLAVALSVEVATLPKDRQLTEDPAILFSMSDLPGTRGSPRLQRRRGLKLNTWTLSTWPIG